MLQITDVKFLLRTHICMCTIYTLHISPIMFYLNWINIGYLSDENNWSNADSMCR